MLNMQERNVKNVHIYFSESMEQEDGSTTTTTTTTTMEGISNTTGHKEKEKEEEEEEVVDKKDATNVVKLESVDGEVFEVPLHIAEMSLTVKHMLQDVRDDPDVRYVFYLFKFVFNFVNLFS